MKDRLRSSRIPIRIVVFLSLTVTSCVVGSHERPKVPPKIELETKMEPQAASTTWEPIFFKAIDERAKIAKLSNLKTAVLQNEDLEVRIWLGFGLVPLEGFVISRKGERWSAIHLRSISPRHPKTGSENVLPAPKSGWNSFWRRLTNEGILTLPDSSELKDEVMTRDGESFVVEIKQPESYRALHYQNPQDQKWPEAAQMVRIAEIVLEEFRINRPLNGR